MSVTVVLQAYGSDTIINQNIYCLLSFLRHSDVETKNKTPGQGVRVVIYTDQPERFRKFFDIEQARDHIQYEDLSPARVKEWRGSINFVHRVKVEMLRDAAKKFAGTRIFYVDGDTVFLRDPSPLFAFIDNRNSVMHELENIVDLGSDPISKKLTRFLQKEWRPNEASQRGLNSGAAMWNAGVLGFSPQFTPHLDEVLRLTESLYSAYPKHIMEQLAFSYYLRTHTRIHDAREFILHYWRDKDVYNERIARFLSTHATASDALSNYQVDVTLAVTS